MTDLSDGVGGRPDDDLRWVRFEMEILSSDNVAHPMSSGERHLYDLLVAEEQDLLAARAVNRRRERAVRTQHGPPCRIRRSAPCPMRRTSLAGRGHRAYGRPVDPTR